MRIVIGALTRDGSSVYILALSDRRWLAVVRIDARRCALVENVRHEQTKKEGHEPLAHCDGDARGKPATAAR